MAKEIVEANLRLVISIIKKYIIEVFNFRFNSRGNIGLMKAVDELNIEEDTNSLHMLRGGLTSYYEINSRSG